MRLMIIDDNQSLLDVYKEVLDAENHEVTYFNSARDALRSYLKDWKYDLVVTDLLMPEKTGEGFIFDIYYINPEQEIAVVSAYTEGFKWMDGMKVRVFEKPQSILEVLEQWKKSLSAGGSIDQA